MAIDPEASTPFPDEFFQGLLSRIDSLPELKVTVYALWRSAHLESRFPAMAEADFAADDLGLTSDQLSAGLRAAVQRGSLLQSVREGRVVYFVDSPQGRAAAAEYAEHGWPDAQMVGAAPLERPNVFRIYEDNLGPLTPLIADALKDAEETYSSTWVADAIELAVKHNKRSWKYCEAILRRWKEEGRAEKQSGRDDQASRQHDVEDKIKRFVGRTGS